MNKETIQLEAVWHRIDYKDPDTWPADKTVILAATKNRADTGLRLHMLQTWYTKKFFSKGFELYFTGHHVGRPLYWREILATDFPWGLFNEDFPELELKDES